jgi:hypothetical protein
MALDQAIQARDMANLPKFEHHNDRSASHLRKQIRHAGHQARLVRAIEDDGNLSSGPFSCLAECIKRITERSNEPRVSKLQ